MNSQFDRIAKNFSQPTRYLHPYRQYLTYYNWLKCCGSVSQLHILDVGCGAGLSSRLLAQRGAIVTGVDNSPIMLTQALQIEAQEQLGIMYLLANSEKLPRFVELYDLVTVACLLHYAATEQALDNILAGLSANLKPRGRLVGINLSFEPPVQAFSPGLSHSAKWIDLPFSPGARVGIALYGVHDRKICAFDIRFWEKAVYEHYLRKNGFGQIRWIRPRMSEEGKKLCRHWQKLEDTCTMVILSATKTIPGSGNQKG